jgi:hypothetical protein
MMMMNDDDCEMLVGERRTEAPARTRARFAWGSLIVASVAIASTVAVCLSTASAGHPDSRRLPLSSTENENGALSMNNNDYEKDLPPEEEMKEILEDAVDEEWPPLSTLIDNKSNVIGDVQFLLDFALIGHSKCATTTQMKWLFDHKGVAMYDKEVHALRKGDSAELVNLLYALPEGRQFKRGYKAPNDIRNPLAIEAFQTLWPKTKFVIGVRHPSKFSSLSPVRPCNPSNLVSPIYSLLLAHRSQMV